MHSYIAFGQNNFIKKSGRNTLYTLAIVNF